MKIVEIKCPSCGGKLKVEDSQIKLITCEYCGNQFLLDDEKDQNITNYNIYHTTPSGSGQGNGARLAVAGGVGFVVFMVFVILLSSSGSSSRSRSVQTAGVPAYTHGSRAKDEKEEVKAPAKPDSPLYMAMTADMFQKVSSDVTQEDLVRVKYLKVETALETCRVWYSFDDPYGGQEPVIQTSSFKVMEWEPGDMAAFTGLVKVDLAYRRDQVDISGLKALKGIVAKGREIQDIADMLADPAQITELELRDITSLDGLSSFVNLERLTVRDLPDTNLKQLVPLKKLKYLSLEDTVDSDSIISSDKDEIRVTDYSAISVMTGLESIYLNSDILKDVGFLKTLPALTDLTLEDTAVFSLEPLAEMTGLRTLSLIDNGKVQDYKPVGMVTGLVELTIDKYTSQTDPDLSALTQLEKLDISGFMSVASLKGLTGIKDLSLHSCNVDSTGALSTLSGVERLTFYSVWNSEGNLRNIDFIKGMTGLKYADFTGNLDGTGWSGYRYLIEVYGDVSSIFNHEGLEELYLDNGTFEINFDHIKENPTLRVLSLKNLNLHKNYYVESYGGMSNIWYDDVTFSEHMDFLFKFPNMEELYLDTNQLTDINFVSNLKKLAKLSLRDNYVTDLGPLSQLENLTWLNISDNPVGDVGDMGDSVKIIQ